MKCSKTSINQLAVSAYGKSTSTKIGRAGKIMNNRDRVGMSTDLYQLPGLLQVLRGLEFMTYGKSARNFFRGKRTKKEES
jgi:hypothetical protein